MSRLSLTCGLFGLAFGAVFAAAGFNQYDVIHQMLLLENLEPGLTMASAVGTAFVILRALERRRWQTPLGGRLELRRWEIERKHVLGGMVFGTGWAVTGACPGMASTMIGGGSVMGGGPRSRDRPTRRCGQYTAGGSPIPSRSGVRAVELRRTGCAAGRPAILSLRLALLLVAPYFRISVLDSCGVYVYNVRTVPRGWAHVTGQPAFNLADIAAGLCPTTK